MPTEQILIVEDEPLIRWVLAEALRDWGYEPLEADRLMSARMARRAFAAPAVRVTEWKP